MNFRIADFQINIARGWLSSLVWSTNVQFVSANHMLDTDRREPRCSFEPISVEPQVLDRLIFPVPRSRRQQGRAHCFSLGRLESSQMRGLTSSPDARRSSGYLQGLGAIFGSPIAFTLIGRSLAPAKRASVVLPSAMGDACGLARSLVFLSTRDKKKRPDNE